MSFMMLNIHNQINMSIPVEKKSHGLPKEINKYKYSTDFPFIDMTKENQKLNCQWLRV